VPKISVRVPHQLDPAAAFERVKTALAKTVTDFQGRDLVTEGDGTSTTFSFSSLAFTIKGKAEATGDAAIVEVDLPFAAMMFKDKAERAITKNVTRALAAESAGEAS
jgi:hypothetical protein